MKKLIEVALPLEKINEESAREKSIKNGHPSTLHLWWARRPLATARAVIWASLVDDPSSHPEKFPTIEAQKAERDRLFSILEELVKWENTNNEEILIKARNEIKNSMGDQDISFLDPFAGGGTIPLEAQRLGLKVVATDLNPVAVLINKAMIEIAPHFINHDVVNPDSQETMDCVSVGLEGLAKDVEYYGNWIGDEAQKRIGRFFPDVNIPKENGGGKGKVITWIRTRTVKCPNPMCGCNMPLIKTFNIVKGKKPYYIDPIIRGKHIEYKVLPGTTKRKETVDRKGAVCLYCDSPVGFDYIRDEGQNGRLNDEIIAVAVENGRGRIYLSPDILENVEEVIRPQDYPDSEIAYYPGCTNCKNYGITNFSDMFNSRQLLSMVTFSDLVLEVKDKILSDMEKCKGDIDEEYANAIQLFLAFAVDRLASRSTQLCIWDAGRQTIVPPFGRLAIPMVWTYPENNPFCDSSGSWSGALEYIPKAIRIMNRNVCEGLVEQKDAMSCSYHEKYIVSTDPPYYSNVPYADLADFFYVWLRKMLRGQYPNLFSTIETPKLNELVAERYRFGGDEEKAKNFFERGMVKTFSNIYEFVSDEVPLTVYYAFKQSELENDQGQISVASSGWETILTGIISSGFAITGTWPMRTERTTGLKNSLNALSTSIVLVCRKRSGDSKNISRRSFTIELRQELRTALQKLQQSNLAPVDMAQSAIGPGMAVFSKYNKVLESDGTSMGVRSALVVINEEIDMYFNEQVSDLDTESRFCVELFSQNEYNNIKFGDAEVLANAKGASIPLMSSHGILYAKAGIVHLFKRENLPEKVDSNENNIWLLTQQLTRAMETGGVEACANIVFSMFGSNAERAKDLAYRLYTIAEQKKWADEAYAYNSLVVAWPDIQSRAASFKASEPKQLSIFDMNN